VSDALLADLQNTITPSPGFKGGKDHLYSNSHDNQVSPPPSHHQHHHHSHKHSPSPAHLPQTGDPHRHSPHLSSPAPPPPLSTSLNNNLNELDSLLQDLSSHKYPPPSSHSPVYATRTSDLAAPATQKGGYAPPPLNTTVKGGPNPPAPQAPPSPSPSVNFHPSANSTALVPSSPTAALSPANMNGTLDSNSSHQYHNHYNGHTSVDSLLDELNASLPER
ncbi:hypothetical protein WDU94_006446, partial [Cyamophila willieti]